MGKQKKSRVSHEEEELNQENLNQSSSNDKDLYEVSLFFSAFYVIFFNREFNLLN